MVELGADKWSGLIEDVLHARVDVLGLLERRGVSAAELAGWVLDEENRRVLAGLCVLADFQTQVLLSRYRLVAAGRLIKLATEEGEGDVARRACVDLLKLELKRAEGGGVVEGGSGLGVEGEGGLLGALLGLSEGALGRAGLDARVLRGLVYGEGGAGVEGGGVVGGEDGDCGCEAEDGEGV